MKFAHLLHSQEGKTLEFKRDLSSPQNITKTLTAFANTAGGIMLMKRPMTRHITCLEQKIKILQVCQEDPHSSSQLLDALGYKLRTGNFKKALSNLLQKKILVMTVPEAPRSRKQKYKINT